MSSNPTQELQAVRTEISAKTRELELEQGKLEKLESETRNVTQHAEQIKKALANAQLKEKQLESDIHKALDNKKPA